MHLHAAVGGKDSSVAHALSDRTHHAADLDGGGLWAPWKPPAPIKTTPATPIHRNGDSLARLDNDTEHGQVASRETDASDLGNGGHNIYAGGAKPAVTDWEKNAIHDTNLANEAIKKVIGALENNRDTETIDAATNDATVCANRARSWLNSMGKDDPPQLKTDIENCVRAKNDMISRVTQFMRRREQAAADQRNFIPNREPIGLSASALGDEEPQSKQRDGEALMQERETRVDAVAAAARQREETARNERAASVRGPQEEPVAQTGPAELKGGGEEQEAGLQQAATNMKQEEIAQPIEQSAAVEREEQERALANRQQEEKEAADLEREREAAAVERQPRSAAQLTKLNERMSVNATAAFSPEPHLGGGGSGRTPLSPTAVRVEQRNAGGARAVLGPEAFGGGSGGWDKLTVDLNSAVKDASALFLPSAALERAVQEVERSGRTVMQLQRDYAAELERSGDSANEAAVSIAGDIQEAGQRLHRARETAAMAIVQHNLSPDGGTGDKLRESFNNVMAKYPERDVTGSGEAWSEGLPVRSSLTHAHVAELDGGTFSDVHDEDDETVTGAASSEEDDVPTEAQLASYKLQNERGAALVSQADTLALSFL
jgi:hypothetical protein